MKSVIHLLMLLSVVYILQGCSYSQRFLIFNSTDNAIEVEILLSQDIENLPIFQYPHNYFDKLDMYDIDKNNNILGPSEKYPVLDTLDHHAHFIFTIPPKKAVEIGVLQNDKYSSYDQKFSNNRSFNLEKIKIHQKSIIIIPSTFDDYFRKNKRGDICFVM